MKSNIIITEKYADIHTFRIEWELKKPIIDLKKRIQKEIGIPIYCQKLFFNGNEISEFKKLLDCEDFKNYNNYHEPYIIVLNLNHLKIKMRLKNIKLNCFLKASDKILDLKKVIYEKENIPIEKMQILQSGNIIEDTRLIEDFISDLNFEIRLLDIEKIKVNIIDSQNIESIYVNPFSSFTEIEKQIKKNFDYRLKYKDVFVKEWKLLIQYNIKNGDNIELFKSKEKIKINILNSRNNNFVVKVFLEQTVSELKEYYLINSPYFQSVEEFEDIEFLYNGCILNNCDILSNLDLYNGCTIECTESFRAGSSKFNFTLN
jgi:hypothetical protein